MEGVETQGCRPGLVCVAPGGARGMTFLPTHAPHRRLVEPATTRVGACQMGSRAIYERAIFRAILCSGSRDADVGFVGVRIVLSPARGDVYQPRAAALGFDALHIGAL